MTGQATNIWYDPASTLSHNCIWNMVLSHRGGGKTFGCLSLCVRKWLKGKRRFIYLRRTDAELQLCKDHLMDAIKAEGHFDPHTFAVVGNDILCDGEVMGYCIALSKAYQMKSVAYPDVDFIIFDEFLIEDRNGRYLPNEPNKVLALMETVGRMRPIVLMMLANYVSKANVYFDYWKLHPKNGAVFTKHPQKPVLIHMYDNQSFKAEKAKTPFAQLIRDTAYGGYLLDNEALADNYTFVETPTGFLDFICTIKFQAKEMGIWMKPSEGQIWVRSVSDPSANKVLAFDTESHAPNVMLLKASRQHPNIKQLRQAIDYGFIRYENIGLKNTILELLNYI